MSQIRKAARAPRLILASLLAAALMATTAGCGKDDKKDPIVASYKGGEVKQSELTKYIHTTTFFTPEYQYYGEDPGFQEYMLKQMVAMNEMEKQATDEARKEAETKTADQMKQMKEYFSSQGANTLNDQLKSLEITEADIQDYMKRSLTVVSDLDKKVTDQQIKDAYDNHLKQDPQAYDVVSVAHILISLKDPNDNTKDLRTKEEALKRAQEVKAKLDKGGDFTALAKEYSDDPGSKDNGGKYENQPLATNQWVPEFAKAAKEQPVGQIGQPFETSFGYHIMRVDKRDTQSLDQVKDSIKGEVVQGMVNDFISKDLPAKDFKVTLPSPSPSASASPAAGGTAASPEASPAASPAASASPAAK